MSKSLRSVIPNFYMYQNHLESLLKGRLLYSIPTIPLSRVGPENLCSQEMISSQMMILSQGVLGEGKKSSCQRSRRMESMNTQTLTVTSESVQFSSVQSLSRVPLFATPRIAARQASLSITNSRSSFRPTSIESVMPSSHLILCHPLLLLPPIPPSFTTMKYHLTPVRMAIIKKSINNKYQRVRG